MIDKDIKYTDRKNFGGGSDMGTVADSSGNVGPGSGGYQGGAMGGYGGPSRPSVSPGGNNDVVMQVLDPVDMPGLYTKSDIESIPVTLKAPSVFDFVSPPGVYSPTNMMFKNMQTLDRFTKARPDAPSIPGISTLLNAVGFDVPNPLQGLSDFTAAKNRDFFQDVIRAGKIPGLNFSTLSDMSDQQLENAYQDYMSKRLSGEIDAYGNKLISTGDDNPLQNLLLAQQLANPTVAEPQENLQGGVAQLYNQYMRNLGYTL